MGLEYSGRGGDGWDASPAIFHQEILKAKLNHRCTECKGIIEAGQHYERVSGLWDSRWSTFRKCTFCMEFESAFDANYRGFKNSSAFGEMLSDAYEAMPNLFSLDHPGRWYSVAKKYLAIKKNYYDQQKRGVVDRSGRGIPRGPQRFWRNTRHDNLYVRLLKEEHDEQTQA